MAPAGAPVPEVGRLLSCELDLPRQGLLLGQQPGPLLGQSLLLLLGPLQRVPLGPLGPQAPGQLLFQGLLLARGLEEGRDGAADSGSVRREWKPFCAEGHGRAGEQTEDRLEPGHARGHSRGAPLLWP